MEAVYIKVNGTKIYIDVTKLNIEKLLQLKYELIDYLNYEAIDQVIIDRYLENKEIAKINNLPKSKEKNYKKYNNIIKMKRRQYDKY